MFFLDLSVSGRPEDFKSVIQSKVIEYQRRIEYIQYFIDEVKKEDILDPFIAADDYTFIPKIVDVDITIENNDVVERYGIDVYLKNLHHNYLVYIKMCNAFIEELDNTINLSSDYDISVGIAYGQIIVYDIALKQASNNVYDDYRLKLIKEYLIYLNLYAPNHGIQNS